MPDFPLTGSQALKWAWGQTFGGGKKKKGGMSDKEWWRYIERTL